MAQACEGPEGVAQDVLGMPRKFGDFPWDFPWNAMGFFESQESDFCLRLFEDVEKKTEHFASGD